MGLSGIKPITTLSSSSLYRKIMQKYQTGKKNTSRFPTMIFYKEKGYFFQKKIIDKNRKWKKMVVSYPFLVYNTASNTPRSFKSKINFFLSFHFQKQNHKFFNILWNHLNLVLIKLKTSLYQSKIETITKNFKKTFLLSITESKNINIDKRKNTNNVIEFFKSGIRVPDTVFIFKKTYIQKSCLFECRFLRSISELRISRIENNIKSNIERLSNKIKNSNLLFILKIPQSLYYPKVTGHLKNSKLLKKIYFPKDTIPTSKIDFIRSDYTLRVLEVLSSKKTLHNQDLLNNAGSLNSSVFLTGIDYWSNSRFLNTVLQLHDILSSKASIHIYLQNFAEKPLRMDFSTAKKMTEPKIVNSSCYFTKNSKLLKANKIKNPVLLFPIKVPENIPDQMLYEFSKSIQLSKNLHFLIDNIFLNKQEFLKNVFALKISNSSAIKNDLYSKYFFNHFFNRHSTLNSNVFSTGIYRLDNISISNTVRQLRNTFFSEALSQVNSKNFSEKSLRMDFSIAKKMTEFRVTGNEHYFTQKSKMFKAQGSENAHPEFESITAFPFRLPNLSLENLIFLGRNTQFSFLISQKPTIVKNNLILSLSDLELRIKGITPVSMKKDLPLFASGNEIPGLEHSKNRNFRINGENLVFRMQSDMEQRIEEKIEQKIRQKIEQIKKASTDVKEASVKQYLSDYSATREFQKQFLDINYISDQVFRLMDHRLQIERERRGIL